jgi:hypothetical protein
LAICGYGIIAALWSYGHGYDDSGLGSVAFVLLLMWNFLAFPFYLVSEGLSALNNEKIIPGHELITALVVLIVLGVVDYLRWRRRNK